MRLSGLLVLTLLGAGCLDEVLGDPCERDEQCGPGYDCYSKVCVRVCTADDQCQQGTVCYRYHCVAPDEPGARPSTDAPATNGGVPQTPPVPDAAAAELRAIRYELGELRRDVARLLKAQGLSERSPPPRTPVPDTP